MSISRNRITKKFTTIPNQIIIDGKLSHGAFRAFSYLLSKPNGWKVINLDIQEQLNIKQSQCKQAHIFQNTPAWHTFARSLVDKEVNLSTIKDLLGHSNISVTAQFYAKSNKNAKRNALFKP